jgi:predicted PurR-regulated permease PerM
MAGTRTFAVSPGWRLLLLWLIAGLLVLVAFVLLRGILLPFLVGMAAAYVLDPLADRLQRLGLGRSAATLTLTVLFFAALVPVVLLLLPVIVEQVAELATQLPGYLEALRARVVRLAELLDRQDLIQELSVQGLVARFSERALGFAGSAVTSVLQSSLAVLNLISLVFITPIVTFYLLRDWDRMVAAVMGVVPPRSRPMAERLAREVDEVLAGFLRGQGLVCLFLACFYAVGLALVGLDHGAIIGMLTGLFSFIPYVGMLVGVAVGLTVAAFQFNALLPVALVAAVFALGQFIEGNFLTPRVVGRRIRLHPVWVIFAVLAGTALFGLAGTFLGTPAAAVIAVLARFGIERWRGSRYFNEGGEAA